MWHINVKEHNIILGTILQVGEKTDSVRIFGITVVNLR